MIGVARAAQEALVEQHRVGHAKIGDRADASYAVRRIHLVEAVENERPINPLRAVRERLDGRGDHRLETLVGHRALVFERRHGSDPDTSVQGARLALINCDAGALGRHIRPFRRREAEDRPQHDEGNRRSVDRPDYGFRLHRRETAGRLLERLVACLENGILDEPLTFRQFKESGFQLAEDLVDVRIEIEVGIGKVCVKTRRHRVRPCGIAAALPPAAQRGFRPQRPEYR